GVMGAPRVRIAELAAAAVAAAALVVVMAGVVGDPDSRPFDATAAVLVVLSVGGLVLHRSAPMVALAVCTAAVACYGLRDHPGGAVYLTVIGAMFAVAVAKGPARAGGP